MQVSFRKEDHHASSIATQIDTCIADLNTHLIHITSRCDLPQFQITFSAYRFLINTATSHHHQQFIAARIALVNHIQVLAFWQ